ncbi:MAG: hypothetical protein WAV46_00610 [Candidatus Moraniibacteriota bacterium]
MATLKEQDGSKRGKRNPGLLSHKEIAPSTYEASRLEGKVQNLGIKNLGHQKKKKSQA